MRLFLITLLTSIILIGSSGCVTDDIVDTVKQSIDEDTLWIYAQINVPEEEGIEDYFYFGRVNKGVYTKFVDHEIKDGVIVFRDVRYWNTDNKIEVYEDAVDTGTLIFRLEDVVYLRVQKGDPLLLESKENIAE